jgi:multicomponent Na+:H+ antiporter subunit G
MIEWLTSFFLLGGAFFVMIATLGVIRFPDTLTRMHAATKAGAFGVALMLIAGSLHWGTTEAVVKSILILLLFYVTTPVASQLLSRAALRRFKKDAQLEVDEWPATVEPRQDGEATTEK